MSVESLEIIAQNLNLEVQNGTNQTLEITNGATLDLILGQMGLQGPPGPPGSGTVNSVGISVPTGFSASNTPVTSSGVIAISYTSGYSLPTNISQSNWDTAYGWGNHSLVGYLLPSDIGTVVQSYSLRLTNIAALSGAGGFLVKTGTDTYILDTTTYSTLTLGSSNGAALGTASAGTATTAARSDHVHPMPSAGAVGAEPTITVGTTSQYWRGDKTWRDFFTDVRDAVLTGLSTASSTAVAATDTVLVAIGKLQAQVNNKLNASGGTASGLILNDGYTEEVFSVSGTTPALAPANGSIQTWTLTANSTPTAGTWNSGQSINLRVDDGSGFTINWTTLAVTWEVETSAAPPLKSTGFTSIVLTKVGTTIFGRY